MLHDEQETGVVNERLLPDGVLLLGPGEGRSYDCGSMRAIFRADGGETGDRYSVSEWWMQPRSEGVHPHVHEENDEIFFVLAGRVTFHVGGAEMEVGEGGFLRVPAGVAHGFRNPRDAPAGVLNVFIPGGFEARMPAIAEWYQQHDLG